MNEYYIYGHVDPRHGNRIFYIGKGVRGRSYSLSNRNNQHLNKLNKILSEGYNMNNVVIYLEEGIYDEKLAYLKEGEYIERYGLSNLVNAVPGGRGGWTLFRIDVDEDMFKDYLKSGISLKDIATKINCNIGGLKKRFFPNCSIFKYCSNHNIHKLRPRTIHINKQEYIKLLAEGKSNKDISTILGINLNLLKVKFYPNSSLQEFCKANNIQYYNTQKGIKNGNYKEFPKEQFVKLIKEGAGLAQLEKALGLSKRVLIAKYKEEFGVSNWKDLLCMLD